MTIELAGVIMPLLKTPQHWDIRHAMIKPTLPESPLPALLDHDGRYQALFPEHLVRQHGEDMIAYERARIIALLDTFGSRCMAQGMALSDTGHANSVVVNAQLDAVRLLQEAINAK